MRRRPPAAPPKRRTQKPKPPATVPRGEEIPRILIPTFGRKPKPITAKVIDEMCQIIRNGGNVAEAALVAGVSPAHYFSWQADANANPTPAKSEFLEALETAKRARSLRMKLRYQKLAMDDAKALQWWLERDPVTREEFRPPKVTLIVEGELSYVLDVLEREFEKEPDIYDRILGAVGRAHGHEAVGGEAAGAGGRDDRPGGEAVLPTRPES